MPRLVELRHRFPSHTTVDPALESNAADECLVFDPRNGLTPKQVVERKLGSALLRAGCAAESAVTFFRTKPR